MYNTKAEIENRIDKVEDILDTLRCMDPKKQDEVLMDLYRDELNELEDKLEALEK